MEGGASKKRKRGPGKSGVSVGELPLKQRQSHATKIPAAAKSRVTPVARPGPMTRTRSGSLPGAGASAVAVGSSEDKAPVVCGACLGPFEGGYDPRSHTNKCYRCALKRDRTGDRDREIKQIGIVSYLYFLRNSCSYCSLKSFGK